MDNFERLKDRSKRNPLVPIGLLEKLANKSLIECAGLTATASALVGGLYYLKRGDSRKQQMFMRYRVGAQLFTVCAILGGMAYLAHTQSNEETK